MTRDYCCVTGGYQSKVVEVKTLDGTEYHAGLQLYGNNIHGWKSEWWKNGMLSDRTKIENVICWRDAEIKEYDSTAQTFGETIKEHEYAEEREKGRKKNPSSRK